MPSRTRMSRAADQSLFKKFFRLFFSSRTLPLFLSLATLAILFVVFRMKSVEMNYKIGDLNRLVDEVSLENKELKAQRAQLLSIRNLKELAERHKFSRPDESRIILIP